MTSRVVLPGLAIGVVVHAAAQVGFLNNSSAAAWAGEDGSGSAHLYRVSAGLAKEVFFSVSTSPFSHGGQGTLERVEDHLKLPIRQHADLPAGVQFCLPEHVLQAAITQTGYALFGGQGRFQTELKHLFSGQQISEICGIKTLRERRGFEIGYLVVGVFKAFIVLPALHAPIHDHRCAECGAIVKFH